VAEILKAEKVSMLVHPFCYAELWNPGGYVVGWRKDIEKPMRTMNALWKRLVEKASRDKTHVFVIAPAYHWEIVNEEGALQKVARCETEDMSRRFEAGLIIYAKKKLGRRLVLSKHNDPLVLEKALNAKNIVVSGAMFKVFGTYADLCVRVALQNIGRHEPFKFKEAKISYERSVW